MPRRSAVLDLAPLPRRPVARHRRGPDVRRVGGGRPRLPEGAQRGARTDRDVHGPGGHSASACGGRSTMTPNIVKAVGDPNLFRSYVTGSPDGDLGSWANWLAFL